MLIGQSKRPPAGGFNPGNSFQRCIVSSRQILVANAYRAVRSGEQPSRIDILIEGDRIVATADPRAGNRLALTGPGERIDASGLVALSGMVNAHVHSNEAFERGLYRSLPLERWLARSYPPLGVPPVPARWHYLRAMLVACDAIHSGTVALQDDFLNPGCDHDALDQVAQAWSDSGLRVSLATTLGDRPYLDGLPFAREMCEPELARALDERVAQPLSVQVDFFKAAHRRWQGAGSGRIGLMLGPRGPQRCSDELLGAVARLSAEHDCAVHMHVLETRTQHAASRAQAGGGFFRRLKRAGLMTPRFTINHAVWVDDDDIRAIADAGACVTHNPLSNQRLGSGTSPVRRLRAAGVAVALGSDGPATGDTACMVAVLRAASLLHRDPDSPPDTWLGPDDAWQMATTSGARSMRLPAAWGALEAGAPADLILLDAGHRSLVPHHDTVAQFALAAGADLVDSVIVAGQIVMRAGGIKAFDEARLLEEAREAGAQWQDWMVKAGETSGIRLDPLIQRVLDRVRGDAMSGAH